MRNLLFVVWRGPIDNLQEEVITARELNYNRAVKAKDVPLEWYNALAVASGLFEMREPEIVSGLFEEPAPPPAPEEVVERPPSAEWELPWPIVFCIVILSFLLGLMR
jgi:hypothetical protein